MKGWAIAQCEGDVVFIPAGAPHQVLITRMLEVLKAFFFFSFFFLFSFFFFFFFLFFFLFSCFLIRVRIAHFISFLESITIYLADYP